MIIGKGMYVMRYFISDIHGCADEFETLLQRIEFSKEEDHLYILGDSVDRGRDSKKVFQRIMALGNSVTYILGNHDFLFYRALEMTHQTLEYHRIRKKSDRIDYQLWLDDGGMNTVDSLSKMTLEEKRRVYNYLKEANLYEIILWKNKTYILVHAGLENFREEKALNEYEYYDFLFARPNYKHRYYQDENIVVVTGHTPTAMIREDNKFEIYKENGHLAIDCGCIYGGRLAAYCLETEEVFYVDKVKETRGHYNKEII